MLRFPVDFPSSSFNLPPRAMIDAQNSPTGVALVEMPSGSNMTLITRFADVTSALRRPTFSRDLVNVSGSRILGDDITSLPSCIFNLEGSEHRRVRQAIGPLFDRIALHHWASRTRLIARQLVGGWTADTAQFDL